MLWPISKKSETGNKELCPYCGAKISGDDYCVLCGANLAEHWVSVARLCLDDIKKAFPSPAALTASYFDPTICKTAKQRTVDKKAEEAADGTSHYFYFLAEICRPVKTSAEAYYSFMAYSYSGASGRRGVIEMGIRYLEMGISPEGLKGIPAFVIDRKIDNKVFHVSNILFEIGKAHEGLYEFDQALHFYQQANQVCPEYPLPVVGVSRIQTKTGAIDAAISFLTEAKKTRNYAPLKYKNEFGQKVCEDWYKTSVDKEIEDLTNKKARGYKYHPKGSREG